MKKRLKIPIEIGEEGSLSSEPKFELIREERLELFKFRLLTFPVNTPPHELSSSFIEFCEILFKSLLSC